FWRNLNFKNHIFPRCALKNVELIGSHIGGSADPLVGRGIFYMSKAKQRLVHTRYFTESQSYYLAQLTLACISHKRAQHSSHITLGYHKHLDRYFGDFCEYFLSKLLRTRIRIKYLISLIKPKENLTFTGTLRQTFWA
ncbi:MAG: hypothetical protein ACKPJF_30460, partial [Dolichospermum sp.]